MIRSDPQAARAHGHQSKRPAAAFGRAHSKALAGYQSSLPARTVASLYMPKGFCCVGRTPLIGAPLFCGLGYMGVLGFGGKYQGSPAIVAHTFAPSPDTAHRLLPAVGPSRPRCSRRRVWCSCGSGLTNCHGWYALGAGSGSRRFAADAPCTVSPGRRALLLEAYLALAASSNRSRRGGSARPDRASRALSCYPASLGYSMFHTRRSSSRLDSKQLRAAS